MLGVLSVLVILGLSILVTRVATVALTHTGLSRQSAAFQARSAFTGVGFTTREAESVVGHPVRRRIIATLMLLGNVGIVTAASPLILGFVDVRNGGTEGWIRLLILVGGVAILILFASSRWVDRWMSAAVSWALDHWTRLDVGWRSRTANGREGRSGAPGGRSRARGSEGARECRAGGQEADEPVAGSPWALPLTCHSPAGLRLGSVPPPGGPLGRPTAGALRVARQRARYPPSTG